MPGRAFARWGAFLHEQLSGANGGRNSGQKRISVRDRVGISCPVQSDAHLRLGEVDGVALAGSFGFMRGIA